MGRVAVSVAELDTPPVDGTIGYVRITSGHMERLVWNAAQQAWIGEPRYSMRQVANVGITAFGPTEAWKYPGAFSESPAPLLNPTAQGFQIHKLLEADEFWATGLRLQEHLAAEIKAVDISGSGNPQVALAWYDLATGDAFLSPNSYNHGVRLVGSRDTTVYHWHSTGWQNSPIAGPPAGKHFYPELYLYGPQSNMRHFSAKHRWIGGVVGGGGSAEQPSKYPPLAQLISWNYAGSIPVLDNQPVVEWPDYSGRGRTLANGDASKRPVVMTEGGIRFVRFDGVNDILRNNTVPSGQPMTVFLVMRQRAEGGAQQVWMGPPNAGAPLLYRGNAADQVNVWAGGSDLIYNRASPWPSSWMIWSVVLDGANTSIWENAIEVASGDAGGGGFTGVALGNNHAESLPAAIDVAEVIVSYKAATTEERGGVIDYLNDKYEIF